jgi:hypothetical protein
MCSDYAYNDPSEENPNSYNMVQGIGIFMIDNVDVLGNNLNKYKLTSYQFNDLYIIPPTLIETFSTTAIFNITIDLDDYLKTLVIFPNSCSISLTLKSFSQCFIRLINKFEFTY